MWVPLYPLGFICEGVIALRDIPYFEETEKFSISLPNEWNFAFYFPNVIRFYLLFGFFPMLYTQMWHMYNLRYLKESRSLEPFLIKCNTGARSWESRNTSQTRRKRTDSSIAIILYLPSI